MLLKDNQFENNISLGITYKMIRVYTVTRNILYVIFPYTKIVCLTLAYSFTLRYLQTPTGLLDRHWTSHTHSHIHTRTRTKFNRHKVRPTLLTYLLIRLHLASHYPEGIGGGVVIDLDSAECLGSSARRQPLLIAIVIDHHSGPSLANTRLTARRRDRNKEIRESKTIKTIESKVTSE